MSDLALQQVGPGAVEPFVFWGLALLIVISAWSVVLSRNIVRMAVYLLLTLAGAAGLYFLLEAEFLGAIQLIVYAGGTLILIVFGVMLTSKNTFLQLTVQLWETLVGVGLALVLAGLLVFALVRSPAVEGTLLAHGTEEGIVHTIGRLLLSTHVLPFEVAAVVLLVVMIGAAYMARRRSRE